MQIKCLIAYHARKYPIAHLPPQVCHLGAAQAGYHSYHRLDPAKQKASL
ncbi:hypothetical protein [Chroococcidiopsis sp. CCMEE 29]|nr:hypothetical protein [Chroococcidiopsis sp. CCMEE 29]